MVVPRDVQRTHRARILGQLLRLFDKLPLLGRGRGRFLHDDMAYPIVRVHDAERQISANQTYPVGDA